MKCFYYKLNNKYLNNSNVFLLYWTGPKPF